jgi:hypothetical protein
LEEVISLNEHRFNSSSSFQTEYGNDRVTVAETILYSRYLIIKTLVKYKTIKSKIASLNLIVLLHGSDGIKYVYRCIKLILALLG